MAMEKYRECLVPRERASSDRLAELILLILAIGCCVAAVLWTTLAFLPAAVFVLLWYLRMNHFRVEHEYILTEEQLTVDVIYNQKRRKRVGEYNLGQVVAAADTQDARLERLRNRKPQTMDFSSHGEKARDLSLFLQEDKKLTEVLLTPDETMKKMILKQVPALARRLEMI